MCLGSFCGASTFDEMHPPMRPSRSKDVWWADDSRSGHRRTYHLWYLKNFHLNFIRLLWIPPIPFAKGFPRTTEKILKLDQCISWLLVRPLILHDRLRLEGRYKISVENFRNVWSHTRVLMHMSGYCTQIPNKKVKFEKWNLYDQTKEQNSFIRSHSACLHGAFHCGFLFAESRLRKPHS